MNITLKKDVVGGRIIIDKIIIDNITYTEAKRILEALFTLRRL